MRIFHFKSGGFSETHIPEFLRKVILPNLTFSMSRKIGKENSSKVAINLQLPNLHLI